VVRIRVAPARGAAAVRRRAGGRSPARPASPRARAAPGGSSSAASTRSRPASAASPRELAAAGLSNRDIAQHLFITARTVEGHLTHAYHKLAITAREQLPAALTPPAARPPPHPWHPAERASRPVQNAAVAAQPGRRTRQKRALREGPQPRPGPRAANSS
jgi:DNA-binding CsgD family transcriptional regulator